METPNRKTSKITNYEEAQEAVKQDGKALKYVPWGQINLSVPATTELCLVAVRQNGKAFKYVPKELRDEVSALSLLEILEELGKYVIIDEDDGEP